MAGVYSTRFYIGVLPTALTTVYTVPAGRVAVLRDIDGTNGVAGDQYLLLYIAGFFVLNLDANGASSGLARYYNWRGRQVLNAGESIQLQASAGGDIALSGYLLTA